MKNKLLLLFIALLSIGLYGQNPTRFPYGVQITGGQTSTAESSKILSQQPGSGTVNYINATNLPISTAVIDSIAVKENINTGFISGLALSINADPTKFDIAPGIYAITDYTDLQNPVSKVIVYAGATGVTPTYLATANASYIELDMNGAIIQSSSPFTNSDRRTNCIIGAVIHSNNINIGFVNEIKAPIVASTNQLHDLMRYIGALNISGNVYMPNGANLQLNKSAGIIAALGINPQNYLDPNTLAIAEKLALTFRYRTQTGTEGSNITSIDPNTYDVGGTITAVPVNKWTVQRYNLFQSGETRAQRGQNLFNSFSEALTGFPTATFVTEQNIAENAVFRAFLIVKQGTTDLQAAVTAGTAKFIPVDKFGNIVSGGSIALTYANIVAALGFTPEDVANKSDSYTVSSSTTYASTKALVDGLGIKANDTDVVHKTGDQTITGLKSFKSDSNGKTISILDSSGILTNEIRTSTSYPNAFFGLNAGKITTGIANSFFGDGSGENNVSGNFNAFFGTAAGKANTSSNNSAFGSGALSINTTGSSNTSIGQSSMNKNLSGNYGTSVGMSSLSKNTTGWYNTAIGYLALGENTTGENNVAIGGNAGLFISGGEIANSISNNSFFMGYNSFPLGNNQSNQIVMGANSTGLGSNTTVLGNSSTAQTWLGGRLTIGSRTDDGTNALQLTGSAKLATTPTTSAGTYDFLTRNASTGVVEKINTDIALTGTPTAPTAAPGTNTTQIATMEAVQAAKQDFQSVLSQNGGVSAAVLHEGELYINMFGSDGQGTLQLSKNYSAISGRGLDGLGGFNDAFFRVSSGLASVVQSNGLGNLFLQFEEPVLGNTYIKVPAKSGGTYTLATTDIKPYKSYTALLSQTGTSAPTATVLENTLGGTIVWTRNSTGLYTGTLAGVFTANKTWVSITSTATGTVTGAVSTSVDTVTVATNSLDSSLTNSAIEIRVYN